MARIGKIPGSDHQSILIDLDDITMIERSEDLVALWSQSQGMFYDTDVRHADAILSQLRTADIEMLTFPVRLQQSAAPCETFYIRPEAVAYMTSAPANPKSDHRAVLLGVDGYGNRMESAALSPAEEQALLEMTARRNPGLSRVHLPDALAKDNAAYTMIDPAKIRRVQTEAMQLHVYFSQSDCLRFRAEKNSAHHLDAFAQAVTAKAPQLNEFRGATSLWRGRFNEIASVHPHRDGRAMTIYFKKEHAMQHQKTMTVSFGKPADTDAAINDFINHHNKGPQF